MTIFRKTTEYYVLFCCEVENKPLPISNNSIGIDMGIENFLITSNGDFVKNPKYYINSQKKLRVIQRAVSRKKTDSNRRKRSVTNLAKYHDKIHKRRLDFAHKEANKIIATNDIICIEDLNIIPLSRGILAKSINDVAWAMFFKILSYKAESAGRKVIKVDPRGTSQRCHNCGNTVTKTLADRWHDCQICNISCHRDINSALEILRLGTNRKPLTYVNGQSVGLESVISN